MMHYRILKWFVLFLLTGLLCSYLSFRTILCSGLFRWSPMLALKPQKFALSFTCGSLTFMGSFGILKGPSEHLKSMFTADRMLFTTIYLGSMMLTLYLTCTRGGLKGYVLVLVSSAVQLVALVWYLVSFIPGGTVGLNLVFRAICNMLQPVIGACLKCQAMCFAALISYFSRSSSSWGWATRRPTD